MKRGKRHRGVQGHALLYGRSSKAIRIVRGQKVEEVVVRHRPPKNIGEAKKQVVKNYKMDDETKKRIDRLKDPLDMMSRHTRAQKYEASNSTEKYEYGISDW